MTVEIRQTAFDPQQELGRYQAPATSGGRIGASVSFIGTMRDFNDGTDVHSMTLEHYPGMTEKHLARICDEARQRWDIADTLIIHRVGTLSPAEPIVLIAVWAAHRAPAFDACRYLIEELKTRAPFWKQEQNQQSARWVERNTPPG